MGLIRGPASGNPSGVYVKRPAVNGVLKGRKFQAVRGRSELEALVVPICRSPIDPCAFRMRASVVAFAARSLVFGTKDQSFQRPVTEYCQVRLDKIQDIIFLGPGTLSFQHPVSAFGSGGFWPEASD